MLKYARMFRDWCCESVSLLLIEAQRFFFLPKFYYLIDVLYIFGRCSFLVSGCNAGSRKLFRFGF